VIAAGCCDDSGFRRFSRQQIGEGAARLERTRVLQKFELQDKPLALDAEIAGIEPDDRRAPNIAADQPLNRSDPGSIDQEAVDAAQNCTLPSEGGAAWAGRGWC
jgi:hypothetical protein